MPLYPRWQGRPACELHFRTWDGEYVVFNRDAGDTHLLSAEAARVLICLEQAPADLEALTRSVAESLAMEPDARLGEFVRSCVAEFQRLELL